MKNLIIMLSLYGNLLYAQSWADVEHYKNDNVKIGLPAPNEQRVVFMGNSITEGWGTQYSQYFEGKPYINRGISGQTTPQMLVRFRSDVINLKPALVIILAGTNDIALNTGPTTVEMIADNLISMAQLAKANGIRVILCSVLPALDYYWKLGLQPAEKIISLNELIKKYASENNIVYLDYYSAMVNENKGLKKEFSNDGIHPTDEGYKVMAPLTDEAIKKAFSYLTE